MSQQKPRKPRSPKSKKINLNRKDQWERLLREVNKEQIPVDLLMYITINLKDGTCVSVNIQELINAGTEPARIEHMINEKLEALDDYIEDVDFHISVDSVVKAVQPFTDQLLRNL
jgi:hypothetical protein